MTERIGGLQRRSETSYALRPLTNFSLCTQFISLVGHDAPCPTLDLMKTSLMMTQMRCSICTSTSQIFSHHQASTSHILRVMRHFFLLGLRVCAQQENHYMSHFLSSIVTYREL